MADWEEQLGLKNVRPFERPMTAGENDKFVGQDELGNNIYETVTGQRYTVRPATAEESKTTRAKVEDWVDEGAPLPTWDQITESVKAIPGAIYDSAASAVRGTGTVGDALAVVPTSGAAGVATRIGQEFDPSVLSAMGATHRVPSYKPVDEVAQRSLLHDEYGNTYERIQFSNPLTDIVSEMEVPNNGLKGSQLIKELQDNPTVRNSQLRSEDWLEAIDPQKRYTKEEIQSLMEGKGWSTFAAPAKRYSSYQRQYNLVDEEVKDSYGSANYVEYAIEAAPNYDQRGFRANSQHYTDDTVAHVRLSERVHGDESYVLVEELQSDLLQQGFQKPTKNWEESKQNYLKQVNDPARFHVMSKIGESDLKKWDNLIYDHDVHENISTEQYEKEFDALVESIIKKSGLENNSYRKDEVFDILVELNEMIPISGANLSVPPVAKTEETVRLGLQTAMAHAYNSGLTKVVIPPFDEIVAKRFDRGSSQFNQAMDPKSGFYATYVKGVEKALRGFQEEFGDKIRITSREMEYDPNKTEYDFNDPILEDDLINQDPTSVEEIFSNQSFIQSYERYASIPGVQAPKNFDANALAKIDEIGDRIVNRNGASVIEALGEDYDFWKTVEYALDGSYLGISFMRAFRDVIDEDIPLSQAIFKQVGVSPPAKPVTEIKQGIEIDFSGLVEDKLDLSKPRFAEGGVVENNRVDPVSGNPVPPGATPKEVRDDVDIKASEGEYIIPANVVRFLGLDKIEKMVSQAKEKLAEMEANGRIGGDKGQAEDDLPFGPEELMTTEGTPAQEKPQMAQGGLVAPNALYPQNLPETNPLTQRPIWELTFGDVPRTVTPPTVPGTPPVRGGDRNPDKPNSVFQMGTGKSDDDGNKSKGPLTGLAGSVDTWTPKDFVNFQRQKNDPGALALKGFASLALPFGGLMVKGRESYLNRRVPEAIDTMLKTGKDLQGNPLSERDRASLEAVKRGLDQPQEKGGLKGLFSGLTGKNESKKSPSIGIKGKGGSDGEGSGGQKKDRSKFDTSSPSGSISLSGKGGSSKPSSTKSTPSGKSSTDKKSGGSKQGNTAR